MGEMGEGVTDALYEDETSRQLVKINIFVEWQVDGPSELTKLGDPSPQDHHQNESGIEIQTASSGTSQRHPSQVAWKPMLRMKLDHAAHKKTQIDGGKDEKASHEGQIIGQIALRKWMNGKALKKMKKKK